MSASNSDRPKAQSPDDLFRFFVERTNAGDAEGLMELYESDGIVMFQPGEPSEGTDAIRQGVEAMIGNQAQFDASGQRPSIVVGGIALTTAQLAPGVFTAEIARRQPDGTWKWVIDNPYFVAG